MSLAVAPGEACYIPCGHRKGDSLAFDSAAGIVQMQEADVLARLKPLLEEESVLKIAQNLKYDYLMLLQRGIRVAPFDDTMLISYVLDAGRNGHGMDELSELHLSHKPIAFAEVAGKGKDKITFDCVLIKEATRYSAEDADVTLRLHALLKPRLAAESKRTVYETLERGLVPVLADMERTGITIDPELLRRLSNDFAQSQAKMGKGNPQARGRGIQYRLAQAIGRHPVRQILAAGRAQDQDRRLVHRCRCAGGPWRRRAMTSPRWCWTGANWRSCAALIPMRCRAISIPRPGGCIRLMRWHRPRPGGWPPPIPICRTFRSAPRKAGRIRQAFVAPKGAKLISADYSQIELRLLAHIADIAQLKKAFADGLDIHAMTASEMFSVPVKDMPAEVRRRAKAINFGIIYGISAFGLANQLGIARGEADDYIKKYFQRFPASAPIWRAPRNWRASTAMSRRCSAGASISARSDPPIRPSAAGRRRAAINAPIQGSAADIIRRAMIRLPSALAQKNLASKMLLQVHDELVLEAKDAEVAETSAIAKSVMEESGAAGDRAQRSGDRGGPRRDQLGRGALILRHASKDRQYAGSLHKARRPDRASHARCESASPAPHRSEACPPDSRRCRRSP